VHAAQLEADEWHQPVPSLPQSPQEDPNLQQPPPGAGAEVDGGDGEGDPEHDGALAPESKLPVHAAQLEADEWHQPVPSLPQSPQEDPNLQQPPPGAGAEVDGGDGEGDPAAVTLTSAHCVQICGVCSQSQRKDNTYSPGGKFSGIFTKSTMRKSIISPQYSARSAGGKGLYAQPLRGPLPHNPGIGVGN